MEEGARRPGTPAIDRELLEEFYSRGHMNCKFGQQLRDWGRQTQATVWRARRAGIPIDVIHDVLDGCGGIAGVRETLERGAENQLAGVRNVFGHNLPNGRYKKAICQMGICRRTD